MKPSFTRRDMLKGAAALVLTSAMGKAPLAAQQAPKPVRGFRPAHRLSAPDRSFRLYPPTADRYRHLLQTHFPELQKDETFQRIASMTAILHHRKGPAVVAHRVRWDVDTESGVVKAGFSRFARPRPRHSNIDKTPVRSAQKAIVAKGDLVLISPFFALSSSDYQRNPNLELSSIVKRGPAQGRLLKSNAQSVSVWLDSVVYEDGVSLGGDKTGIGKKLNIRRHAEDKLAHWVKARVDQGRSMRAISQELHKIANGKPTRSKMAHAKAHGAVQATASPVKAHKIPRVGENARQKLAATLRVIGNKKGVHQLEHATARILGAQRVHRPAASAVSVT